MAVRFLKNIKVVSNTNCLSNIEIHNNFPIKDLHRNYLKEIIPKKYNTKANDRRKGNGRGFTLIELLVVMGIIALLVSIMMPALGRARAYARRTACQSNLHAVGISFRLYLDDNRDVMPIAAQLPSTQPDLPRIGKVMGKYLPSPEILRCPADTQKNYYQKEGSSYEYPTFLCGKKVEKTFLGRKWGETRTPVMYDYEPFHGDIKQEIRANYLFADGHVGQLK